MTERTYTADEVDAMIARAVAASRPPAAQPAPVQEPVATLFGSLPVYDTPPAAQRQWVGLTDDEILKLAYPIRWQEVDDFEADKAVNFAQAIEAKLRSKNNG